MNAVNFERLVDELADSAYPGVNVNEQVVLLKSRYDEPWRHYHTFEHPREMFGTLLTHRDLVTDMGAVAWAIMYHDAVYDPTAEHGKNEELSARLAEYELSTIVGSATASRVAHYTRETVHHTTDLDDPDLDLFMDIDLTIIGSNPARYERYTSDVRKEYGHVSDDAYRLGRIAILESLANRVEKQGLFRTPTFAEIYEDQAQENIAREIDLLRK